MRLRPSFNRTSGYTVSFMQTKHVCRLLIPKFVVIKFNSNAVLPWCPDLLLSQYVNCILTCFCKRNEYDFSISIHTHPRTQSATNHTWIFHSFSYIHHVQAFIDLTSEQYRLFGFSSCIFYFLVVSIHSIYDLPECEYVLRHFELYAFNFIASTIYWMGT